MATWYNRGFYDDIVRRADALIGDNPVPDAFAPNAATASASANAAPDARLLFWRGKAFQRLGWWPEAVEDLTRADERKVPAQVGAGDAAAALQQIARLQALLPQQYRELSSGGDVVFRVYYTSDNPLAREIIARLPDAYRISRQMFGTDVLATPVFIFDSYPAFRAFYIERNGGKAPGSWVWAAGSRDGLFFSLQRPDGTDAVGNDPDYFHSTIAHEFNHAMFFHLMGTTPMPDWFVEGIAQVAGGVAAPRDVAYNDYTVARLFAVNALVPPAQLEQSDSFGAHTEVGAQLDRMGAGKISPSPYAQGYSMTRYLLSNLKRGQLEDFLNDVRDKNDFSAAFANNFGATIPEFYQSWYRDTARKLGAR